MTFPEPGFPALAEAASLAALTRVTGVATADADSDRVTDTAGDAFAPLWEWLDGEDADVSVRRLHAGFGLSRADLAVVALLFAAGTSEVVARACADAVAATGGVAGGGVPLWLACRAVPGLDPGALAASGPLTRFEMVLADAPAPRIESRLTLAAPLVDRLLGHEVVDPVLAARIGPVPSLPDPTAEPDPLAAAIVRSLAAARTPLGLPPLVMAPGIRIDDLGRALRSLGLRPCRLAVADIPEDPAERERLALRWSREAALDAAALILHDAGVHRPADGLAAFADRVLGHVLLIAPQPPDGLARGIHTLPPAHDDPASARRRWAAALGPARTRRVGAGLTRVAAQFRLDPGAVDAAAALAAAEIEAAGDERTATAALWHAAARAATPEPLPGVRIVEPAYRWDDIVLPAQIEAALRRIELHVRHAARVFDDWGFADRMGGRGSWRGRGVAALFAGPSGTGKTMAAEVLAASLDLRVMAIDISRIISKYVGETSKNIASVFAQAERSGAVMVWNEGDAVWGTRGGVGNAVDRHVNAEVGDLLQRIEEFSGFTVVTTNLRHAIDPAFLRRFRFVIDFPMPSEAERLRLWSHAFPPAAPIEIHDWSSLAALPLTGGSIRNVALGAAFLAVEAGTAVGREMIEAELAEELRKQNLPVPRLTWADAR
ncbi:MULTISPECIES: ATP-binding protein [unclassified Micromonospora]|uniref:ATP-binding protein n=1 Tax=unclassified Micromonospora TaxID=2617518 RepID=UPI002FEEA7B6